MSTKKIIRLLIILIYLTVNTVSAHQDQINLAKDYFIYKNVKHICYFSCGSKFYNNKVVKEFNEIHIRAAGVQIDEVVNKDMLRHVSYQWNVAVGVLLDGGCEDVDVVLLQASKLKLFDAMHAWLVITPTNNAITEFIDNNYQHLNLSIDADIAVVHNNDGQYTLLDVFNFGKIQGNPLEVTHLGSWCRDNGLRLSVNGYKYYNRWNFHNLTLRAISVILDSPQVFEPEQLSEDGYTAGVAAMTKITSQLLNILKEKHNFRFNYTIAGKWIGSPIRNSTLAVTNSLFWEEQDISSTCARIFPMWLNWVDICFPPTIDLQYEQPAFLTQTVSTCYCFLAFDWLPLKALGSVDTHTSLDYGFVNVRLSSSGDEFTRQCFDDRDTRMHVRHHRIPRSEEEFQTEELERTKFYYLMPDKGVGKYENQFLIPMSVGVWWCTLGACGLCTAVLAVAAWIESRPKPGIYALFSVTAAIFQQDFEDGIQQESVSSEGRKLTLLVVGLTSMLLYNYYTSSVVSWLLNAAAPSIDSLDELMESNLELIFEDVGYTRGWLDNPGVYYYSGYPNPKEDELRERKVTKYKRTVTPLQSVATGVHLMRTGSYAYHAEPYTASEVISRTFRDEELCEMGSLQMMMPSPVYIMVQKRSPYREFFVWSLMRLSERGQYAASRGRFSGSMPACSGRTPRALALGQAAPAFLILLQLTLLSVLILMAERLHFRLRAPAKQTIK